MSIRVLIQDERITLHADDTDLAPSRPLDAASQASLRAIAERYHRLEQHPDPALALTIGRELFGWLDAGDGRLARGLAQAAAPLLFAVHCPSRAPSAAEWAVLHAPWELLADARDHLAADPLLGFAPYRRLGPLAEPPPADDHRLGLCFMAASPADQPELDFEAEEQAILSAVGNTQLDLVVEESGAPETLGTTLRDSGQLPVLHLSCHGHAAWREQPDQTPRPVLMLEDGAFGSAPTDAPALLQALRPHPPRLVFLSACLTARTPDQAPGLGPGPGQQPLGPWHKDAAADAKVADGGAAASPAPVHSLTTSLLRAGLPAVLGWDGSVADRAATAFAAGLYRRLAARDGLAAAVAAARAGLLGAVEPVLRADWHLARLWLGDRGAAAEPFVPGRRKRSLLPADHVQKQLLAKDVPVAAHGYFVGRRRELQTALATLADGVHAGVLLTGMGRLGKSSLAARIANRLRDQRALAVVHGRFGVGLLLERLEEALQDQPAAAALLAEQAPAVRAALPQGEDAGVAALRPLLLALLNGPCQQRTDTGDRPLLLLLDDFEQLLLEAPGPRPVDPAYAPLVRLLLEVFTPERSDSRLLVTSRFPFTLPAAGADLAPRLRAIPLGSFRPTEQQKLRWRQQSAARGRADAFADLPAREALLERAGAAARGNPGLMDLIGANLVLNPSVPRADAEAALADMEAHLEGGDLPADEQLRGLLERIAADRLLHLAGDAGRDLLRALALFPLPLPETLVTALQANLGGDGAQLRALGLLEPGQDPADPARTALRVSPLAAGRLPPLTAAEQQAVAALALTPLHAQRTAHGAWPAAVDLELCRLALLAADHPGAPGIAEASAAAAIELLVGTSYADAAELARALLRRLHGAAHPPTPRTRAAAAKALAGAGHGDEADAVLRDAGDDGGDWAGTLKLLQQRGERLSRTGDLQGALAAFEEAASLARAHGHDQGAAAFAGYIADILQARGNLDEALRIRTEDELPVYERLGDVRAKAVTQGKIADILQARGNLDEALRIRTEDELPVYERLGDVRSMAVTQGKIADILQARGNLDEALRIRTEDELPVYERLGDVRAKAVTQGKIADILQARGNLDEALRIRTEDELPVYERLGDVRAKAVTQGKIADILQARGNLDEALRIRTEDELPVYERLGDVREKAVTQGKIADILQARGNLDEALRIRTEDQLPVYERLGDVRSMAVTQGQIADILQARGNLDEALRIRTEDELPVYERLGDVRSILVCRTNIAIGLIMRVAQTKDREDVLRANELLCLALADARRLGLPEAGQIEGILAQVGMSCDAPGG